MIRYTNGRNLTYEIISHWLRFPLKKIKILVNVLILILLKSYFFD